MMPRKASHNRRRKRGVIGRSIDLGRVAVMWHEHCGNDDMVDTRVPRSVFCACQKHLLRSSAPELSHASTACMDHRLIQFAAGDSQSRGIKNKTLRRDDPRGQMNCGKPQKATSQKPPKESRHRAYETHFRYVRDQLHRCPKDHQSQSHGR